MTRTSSAPTPRSYDEAAEVLASGRDKDSRKIANNTWLERRGENAIAVRLHGTDVVTFHDDGSVQFSTGGWNTSTTRARLNAYAPAGVRLYTRRGVLYFDATNFNLPLPATEGMRYYPQTGGVLDGSRTVPAASSGW